MTARENIQLIARENIALGAISLIGNKQAIERAATVGGAKEVIDKPQRVARINGEYAKMYDLQADRYKD